MPAPLLAVYPNPASVYVTIQHTLPLTSGSVYVIVRDAAGREVADLPATLASGPLLWDTREVPAGTYSVELMQGSEPKAAERLVVKP